jgi:hypothetical protein
MPSSRRMALAAALISTLKHQKEWRDSWQGLKDKVASTSDRQEFQVVEDTILDG